MPPGLLQDPSSEVVFFLSGLSKRLCSSLRASKGLDWVLFRCLTAMYHRSITAGCSAHIFFLLHFPAQNSCREDISQSCVPQNFLIKMALFFKIKTKLSKRRLSLSFTYFSFAMFVTTVMRILSIPSWKLFEKSHHPTSSQGKTLLSVCGRLDDRVNSDSDITFHENWKTLQKPAEVKWPQNWISILFAKCVPQFSVQERTEFVVQMGFLIPSRWYLHTQPSSLPPSLLRQGESVGL